MTVCANRAEHLDVPLPSTLMYALAQRGRLLQLRLSIYRKQYVKIREIFVWACMDFEPTIFGIFA